VVDLGSGLTVGLAGAQAQQQLAQLGRGPRQAALRSAGAGDQHQIHPLGRQRAKTAIALADPSFDTVAIDSAAYLAADGDAQARLAPGALARAGAGALVFRAAPDQQQVVRRGEAAAPLLSCQKVGAPPQAVRSWKALAATDISRQVSRLGQVGAKGRPATSWRC
jgi:hypothetical protein